MSGSEEGSRPASRGTEATAQRVDRRRFLVTLGGAAAYVALRPHVALARKVARSVPPLQPWSLPGEPPADPTELARAIVAAAVLAPSHWNAQPWRMEVSGGAIRLLPDSRRALSVTDPDRVSMMMSLGAALENMLVTMRAYGFRPMVTYHHEGEGNGAAVAEVKWVAADRRRDRDLFLAIPERRTNRRKYDGRGIFMQNRSALMASVPSDLRLHWLDDQDQIHELGDLVHEATRALSLDRKAQAERVSWMRFSDGEARRTGDGITMDALDLGGPARWFARRYFDADSRFLGLGAGSAGKQAREAVRSSGALALLSMPRGAGVSPLLAGQAYERFALRATRLGIAHQPLRAPIESANHRADLLRAFGALGEDPLLLVRLGHARRPPASMRRAVSVVASFRNS
jgi:hypothetical protein